MDIVDTEGGLVRWDTRSDFQPQVKRDQPLERDAPRGESCAPIGGCMPPGTAPNGACEEEDGARIHSEADVTEAALQAPLLHDTTRLSRRTTFPNELGALRQAGGCIECSRRHAHIRTGGAGYPGGA